MQSDVWAQAVSVNLVRREAPYEPPARPRYQAFQGTGRTLASAPSAVFGGHKASGIDTGPTMDAFPGLSGHRAHTRLCATSIGRRL